MTTGDELIGAVLDDRYRIGRVIGRGGMGVVYEAEATRLGRLCAVKVLLPEFTGSEQAVQRFRREAHVAARVKHPNVVEIFDTGTTAAGAGYIAMELLAGESLDRTLRREGRLPWSRVRHIAVQVCRALAAAHAQHIVHRDMKPENCFRLSRDGDHDVIKVLDFGIAKLTDVAASPEALRLTETNAVIGTYAYMAFEQIAGRDCDRRVDVWALGVMIYEMLTGVLPFRGDNPGQIWTEIFQGTPLPLAHQAPDAGIPEAVEDLVRRALAKDRDQRFADADALAQAILDVPAESSSTSAAIHRPGAARSGTAFAPTQPATPRHNLATDRVDPDARTALAPREVAPTDEALRTAQTSLAPPRDPPAAALAPAPPSRRMSRRALLFFGALGGPALVAALVLTNGTSRKHAREQSEAAASPQLAAPPPAPLPLPPLPLPTAEPPAEPEAPPSEPEAPIDAATAVATEKATKAAPYSTRIAAELKRVQARVKHQCIGVVGNVDVNLEISAETGRVVKSEVKGLSSTTLLARCAVRELKDWKFPRGGPGDDNFQRVVTFSSR